MEKFLFTDIEWWISKDGKTVVPIAYNYLTKTSAKNLLNDDIYHFKKEENFADYISKTIEIKYHLQKGEIIFYSVFEVLKAMGPVARRRLFGPQALANVYNLKIDQKQVVFLAKYLSKRFYKKTQKHIKRYQLDQPEPEL